MSDEPVGIDADAMRALARGAAALAVFGALVALEVNTIVTVGQLSSPASGQLFELAGEMASLDELGRDRADAIDAVDGGSIYDPITWDVDNGELRDSLDDGVGPSGWTIGIAAEHLRQQRAAIDVDGDGEIDGGELVAARDHDDETIAAAAQAIGDAELTVFGPSDRIDEDAPTPAAVLNRINKLRPDELHEAVRSQVATTVTVRRAGGLIAELAGASSLTFLPRATAVAEGPSDRQPGAVAMTTDLEVEVGGGRAGISTGWFDDVLTRAPHGTAAVVVLYDAAHEYVSDTSTAPDPVPGMPDWLDATTSLAVTGLSVAGTPGKVAAQVLDVGTSVYDAVDDVAGGGSDEIDSTVNVVVEFRDASGNVLDSTVSTIVRNNADGPMFDADGVVIYALEEDVE